MTDRLTSIDVRSSRPATPSARTSCTCTPSMTRRGVSRYVGRINWTQNSAPVRSSRQSAISMFWKTPCVPVPILNAGWVVSRMHTRRIVMSRDTKPHSGRVANS